MIHNRLEDIILIILLSQSIMSSKIFQRWNKDQTQDNKDVKFNVVHNLNQIKDNKNCPGP